MTEIHELLETTLRTCIAPDVRIHTFTERPGEQGYSGATLRYYDVAFEHNGTVQETTLVTKDAPLVERKAFDVLQRRTTHVPWNYSPDLDTDAALPVCMQYVGDSVWPSDDRARQAARALAAVHTAYLGHRDDLGWLPRADADYIEQFIVNACWRRGWSSVRSEQRFIDGFGNDYGPIKPGANFEQTLAKFTAPIEAVAARLIEETAALWREATSLTIIHADFHDAHVRFQDGGGYVIDWGSVHYESFYIDLPNYFNRDEVLRYRDALAEQGHDVPVVEFLAHYDAVCSYPGFKYFGIGLANWCYGDVPHRTEDVLHFVNMIVDEPIA